MSDTQLERKPTKRPEGAKSTSQSQKHANYSPPDVHRVEDFGEAAWAGNAESSIKDLIQFFRKTPPPPTNFMSIPDNFNGSSEEDKWDKFKTKVFRRPSKKTRRKRPPVITLPDSAVASRTTDGHRYIAISIPMEYSPLELRPASQGPIFSSLEAEFQRDVNSKLGTWKISPANRLVTVLNPVPEDLRESLSSSSPLSTTLEQPDQLTALSAPSMRKRAHTIPLSPGQEQRYAPEKVKEPARYRSVSDPQTATAPSTRPQSSEEKRVPLSATAEKSGPGPTKKDVSEIDTAEPSPSRLPEKPVITLTLPRRKSSLRGSQLKPAPPETTENLASARQGSASSTNSNGNGHKRGSFAASIDTTSSSPQLLKATTAVVGQSIPVVVRPASADDDSPLDLNFPEPPSAKWKTDRLPRTSAVGSPPPISTGPERSQSRKERVRERKQRDTEKQRAQMEHKGKGKEPSHSLGFLPGIPAAIPGMLPSAILGYRHHQEREDDDDDSPSPSPTESSVSSHDRGLAETVPSPLSQKEKREEREARYVAKALAEERETLEHLPREELIQRYEKLREQRIYERERRLRKLERSRDTWIRAVPVLLQDLNSLLRQQHRILEGAGLTYSFPTPAGSSQHHHGHHHHLRHIRRRSRSVEVSSSSSPLSDPDPLETRRSRSLHSSGESRRERRSSKVTP
ncbi:hypothetical protein FHL15_000632 [Xylaria flabelliformis]|uniref:Uncharacterized protein n=1 Tax=Xylaria flabelliformis TaxID=2512241 RepID=A0A553IEC1_9PEZI|nr:hypothetical protein FHL15_000632 [Xylaria flabelliformis]